MVPKIFVDSDVIIDFFTDREPFVNSASELLDLNEKGFLKLHMSAVSINNIYYIVRRYLGHKRTLEVVEELLDITEVIGTTKKEMLQALKNDFNDYEDSVQYSTALTIEGIEAIITRNVKDYRNSEIGVFTPTNYLKMKNE